MKERMNSFFASLVRAFKGLSFGRTAFCFLVWVGCTVGSTAHSAWAINLESGGPSLIPKVSLGAELERLSRQFDLDLAQPRLKRNLDFWISIYAKYTSQEGLIHDAKYVDHIYQRVSLKTDPKHKTVKALRDRWKKVLLSVHQKRDDPEKMTAEEKRVYEMYRDVPEPDKFLRAAHRKRIRFQLGQKDRFAEGLRSSGKYTHQMEKIFKEKGLPPELTRLPFVESGFNLKARSKVGASGIWQFMIATARNFMRVDESVDERNDPLFATRAAAALLAQNHEFLKTWPLAITAYNHGRKSLMRATRRIGSDDYPFLLEEYRQRSFGFASQNFLFEFLAAVEVSSRPEVYFGRIAFDGVLPFAEVKLQEGQLKLKTLLKRTGYSKVQFSELNPSLTEAVWDGKLNLPLHFPIRIPREVEESEADAIQAFWESLRG